jgi:hypothetical protein
MTDPTDTPTPAIYAADAAPDGLPILHGVPWPAGAMPPDTPIAVRTPGGELRPATLQSLVTWPDGSVRWGLVAFAATTTGYHTIECADAGTPAHPVTCADNGDTLVIDNGAVTVNLSRSGTGPIHSLRANGHDYLNAPDQFRLAVDDASTLHENERKITVLASSSLRVRVRIEGAHYTEAGTERLNYRLDVELWAGWPTLRLDYQFMHVEPGCKTIPIDRVGIDWDWQLHGDTQRHFLQWSYGLYFVQREVRNPQRVAFVANDDRIFTQIESPEMLLDDVDYPDYLRPPLVQTDDWLGVTDGSRSIYVRQHDFSEMRPSRLASDGNAMSLDAWPATAPQLALPQGRTRRQIVTIAFAESATCEVDWIRRALLAPLCNGRCYVSPEWLRACGEFDQDRLLCPGSHTRFEKYLHRLLDLEMPLNMFDLGDTPDAGYQGSYIGSGSVARRPDMPNVPVTYTSSTRTGERVPPWSHPEFFETVWANNEYDAIFAFASEIMRRGRYDLWPVLERLARHNIEVDFLHYHDERWLHRATPAHSADHTTTGAYPSHFWTQGLLAYYCMSGDVDAMEVACALGDKIIETNADPELSELHLGFNREIGWPVLALSYLDAYTGEARFRKQLEDLVDFLVAFDRGHSPGTVILSCVNPLDPFHRQLVGAFFGYASMVEGIDHYVRRTDNTAVRQWLVTFMGELLDALREAHHAGEALGSAQMHMLGMAIGYELTGEADYLDVGMVSLQELLDSEYWSQPSSELKFMTMVYRGLPRFLYHAITNGLTDRLDVRC